VALYTKPLIFVVISFLVVALIHSSISTSGVFAAPSDPNFGGDCETFPPSENGYIQTCCWTESVPPGTGNPDLGGSMEKYCQSCYFRYGDVTSNSCSDKELQYLEDTVPGTGVSPEDGVLEQPPRPPLGPFIPPQDGVIQQQPPNEGEGLQPLTRGQGVLPPGGVLERPPVDQVAPESPTGEEAKAPLPTTPTGGCVSTIITHCVPCDPGIPGANCTPSGEWPPVMSTDTGIPQTTEPPDASPSSPLVGEIAPEAEQPPATEETQPTAVEEEPLPPCPEGQVLDEETGLCVMEDCPEGQVLDEETNLCVPIESQQATEEPEQQQQTEEEQLSEEPGSEDRSNN
jgi:hypothetical protein